ncbi:hypothetical protein EXIGLDRAFT_692990 [Exidia glandulosa HHB12029]|uniref:Uncharacterized protein n=1 Tax=Exidia glandulosa HHB12029 TaxID=1314781 RepID=A0A166MH93_EXIGL|nr:hypothetical protein EXIGLDRAFT_692990 [Exidia glandulosa HHB12029]
MLVESAALYSAFSLIFIVAYGRNSPVQNLFLPPLAQIQCIAPLLILLRVAYGRAYNGSMSTAAKSTSIGFARAKRPGKSETMVGNAGKDASHEFGSHISLSTLSRAKDVESV